MPEKGKVYTLTAEELRTMQQILLEMLIELDRICKKHDIKYGIDGGTLLGAVRHKGFIPWDDDLDVVMTRVEYEKFRAAAIKELDPQKYFYQDHKTDPEYRWGYARIRRVGTEFVRVGQEHLKMRSGVFLDIFPRDNVPDSPWLQPFHSAYCWFWRKVLYSEVGKISAKTAALRLLYRVINVINAKSAFRKLDKLAERCNKKRTRLTRCYAFPLPQRSLFGYKREWFEQFTEYEFEALYFTGAKDAHGYLTCDYGDYMQLPPPEKRRWHPCSRFKLPEDAL